MRNKLRMNKTQIYIRNLMMYTITLAVSIVAFKWGLDTYQADLKSTSLQEQEMASRMAEIRLKEASKLLKIEEMRQKTKISQDSSINYLNLFKTISGLLIGFSPLINSLGIKLIKVSILPKIISTLSFGLIDMANNARIREATEAPLSNPALISHLNALAQTVNANATAVMGLNVKIEEMLGSHKQIIGLFQESITRAASDLLSSIPEQHGINTPGNDIPQTDVSHLYNEEEIEVNVPSRG